MKIQDHPPLHLTYCLNIHPGESWRENLQAIQEKALAVRDRLGVRGPFGLGLRRGRRAADELAAGGNLERFRAFLASERLYVFTVNGFPYGPFHGTPVKEDVYRPDWRTTERRDYSILLADLLCGLLPPDVSGSISTVPGSYKSWVGGEEDVLLMARNLCDVALHLDRLAQDRGRSITLALEPEPDCFIETTEEAIGFFQCPLLAEGRRHLQQAGGLSASEAEAVIRRHLSVCLDLAHAAVEFEDPLESLRRLASAGIAVGKVQLSAALVAPTASEARRKLEDFRDRVYLHQVKVRREDGAIRSFPALPAALACEEERTPADEWRVHFHVPLFCDRYGPLESSASRLGPAFWDCLRGGASEHLEIETYTFGVLPAGLGSADVVNNIVREYRWVLERLGVSLNNLAGDSR